MSENGINRSVLVGYSTGATVAAYLATNYPQYFDRHTILICPWIQRLASLKAFQAGRRAAFSARHNLKSVVDQYLKDPPSDKAIQTQLGSPYHAEFLIIHFCDDQIAPPKAVEAYSDRVHRRTKNQLIFNTVELAGDRTTILDDDQHHNDPQRRLVCRIIVDFLRGNRTPFDYYATTTRTQRDHTKI